MNIEPSLEALDKVSGPQLSAIFYPYLIENTKDHCRFILFFNSYQDAIAYCEARGLTVI